MIRRTLAALALLAMLGVKGGEAYAAPLAETEEARITQEAIATIKALAHAAQRLDIDAAMTDSSTARPRWRSDRMARSRT